VNKKAVFRQKTAFFVPAKVALFRFGFICAAAVKALNDWGVAESFPSFTNIGFWPEALLTVFRLPALLFALRNHTLQERMNA